MTAVFVIADLEGQSHAYFESYGETCEALLEMHVDDPDALDELLVVAYDGKKRVGKPMDARTVLGDKAK